MWVFKDQILQPSSFNFSTQALNSSQFQYRMELIKDARHFASAYLGILPHGELASNCGVYFPFRQVGVI